MVGTDPTVLLQKLNGRHPPSPNGVHASGDVVKEPPHLTDMGNAERLVAAHGEDLRYCYLLGKWIVWDRRRWHVDARGDAVRLAKETVRQIYAEAADASDEDTRKATAKHATRSESVARIDAMITLAQSEPGVPVEHEELDRDRWLLNVQNGTINLQTGDLLPHDRAHLITKLAPVDYDPAASCPVFDAFLSRIMDGNEGLLRFIQRAAGYSLTGDTSERALFILHGEGRNGKSTLLEVLRTVLGDYAVRTPTDTLMAKRDTGIPNDVAALRGARFVSASEADEGRRLAEATIKDLTGGDTISARFMRGEFFNFAPTFKLWLGTNHKPTIRGTDRAIWDRIRLVPFSVRIPDEQQDKRLREKLLAEASGILAWAVEGCLDWQHHGLGEPQEVTDATAGYRSEMDVLGGFLDDRCVVHDRAQVTAKALYVAYQEWCDETGEKPLTQKAVGQRLAERGFDSARLGKSQARAWLGVGIKVDEPDPSDGLAADASQEADTSRRDFRHNPSKYESRELIRENVSRRVCEENASASGGYGSSSLPWDDIPATGDDPEDDPWRR